MLSYGDSKAYDAVTNMKPYGNKLVKKEECVNHVATRMWSALETLKKKSQGSGVPLGGRGMLTATMIKTLQTYYQMAIKNNAGNTIAMKQAIMATPYHVTSSDDDPDHRYCPEKSWCWYKNPERPKTSPDLPKQMLEKLLPVYERLSNAQLLERCSRVSTQNANESLNGVIWRRCPKAQWFGKESVKVAAIMGVISFNSSESQLTTIAEKFGLAVGANTAKHAKSKDEKRARREVPESGERKNRKHRQVKERQRLIEKEGVTNAAGRFGDGL